MTVQIIASKPHYIDHLLPVWWALEEEERGSFVVPEWLEKYLRLLGVEPGRPQRGGVTLAAGWSDIRGAPRGRKVLMEHGIGQTYPESHLNPHYAGAPGRSDIDLFLAPNDRVLRLNQEATPTSEHALVGSPRMDYWFRATQRPRRQITFSFHWRCGLCEESDTSFDHYKGKIESRYADLSTTYHSHSLISDEVSRLASLEDIPYLTHFNRALMSSAIYACDNSSTLYEFAALDRPVIVLNHPGYRRSVEHGLRFWEYADVGVQVEHPGDLRDAVEVALDDPVDVSDRRKEITEALFPYRDSKCAARAVDAIRSISMV